MLGKMHKLTLKLTKRASRASIADNKRKLTTFITLANFFSTKFITVSKCPELMIQ